MKKRSVSSRCYSHLKVYSSPSDEIRTYQGAKGSGAIAQAMTLMISLSRPGFNPRYPEDDKYFTINALKIEMGHYLL
ncbi:MAG: hypothetical protein HC836_40195 [Richelia sp. RM2_1_2]|nr:hypothetical protein [Richelia sp. RM2_1_2]